MRLTATRQLIYDVFAGNDALLCAEDIKNTLSDHVIDLSTIYRGLEYFVKKGILGTSNINKTSYYYLMEGEHHHYMICTNCLTRIPLECEIDKLFKKTVRAHKFVVTGHDLTIYGYCEACKPTSSKKKSH